MTFDDLLAQVLDLLQREGRMSYRALKRRFNLDDNDLEDLKDEIIAAKQLAMDEQGRVLVWTGGPVAAHAITLPPQTEPHPTRRTGRRHRLSWPQRPRMRPRPNGDSLQCCSVTWWTRPAWPGNATRKTGAMW